MFSYRFVFENVLQRTLCVDRGCLGRIIFVLCLYLVVMKNIDCEFVENYWQIISFISIKNFLWIDRIIISYYKKSIIWYFSSLTTLMAGKNNEQCILICIYRRKVISEKSESNCGNFYRL